MEIEMKKMTWQEFNDRKDEAVVILPIGSLEQHGPHLPLSTDTIISYNLALLLAKEANGIVPPSGLLATARTSSKEKGELMTKEVIDKFKKIIKEAFD